MKRPKNVADIYSKREKAKALERNESPEAYEYHTTPMTLRVQVEFIMKNLGMDEEKRLGKADRAEDVLKIIEDCFGHLHEVLEAWTHMSKLYEAIQELNWRFLEHDVGYQYVSGQMIRIDDLWIHSHIMLPTLLMLSEYSVANEYPKYGLANKEYLCAHMHYRKGEYRACYNESMNALESFLEANEKEQYSKAVATFQKNSPLLRDQLAHKGEEIPEHIAGYGLYMAAFIMLMVAKKISGNSRRICQAIRNLWPGEALSEF